jgi:hypothetical protein
MKFGVMGGHHVSPIGSNITPVSTLTSSQFSMMKDPHASELGQLIKEGIEWKA